MRSVLFHLKALILNLASAILNLVIKRDKGIWLFGSWMGTRFADNSRYLFQYLNDNKSKYEIKKVIWITRNRDLQRQLQEMGYTAEMANSIYGIYIHLKAGVHVVCNMAYSNSGYKGDINGNLSNNAVKIQLWHGFPIKSNVRTTPKRGESALKKSIIYRRSLPGRWAETQYVVSMSEDCTRRYKIWFNNPDLRTIECGYPRNCECIKHTDIEKMVIQDIKKYKKTILYLPTFRGYPISFKHPLTDKDFCKWIKENDILWIEKPHLASSMTDYFNEVNELAHDNILRLDGDFDVNVLLPIVSVLVTDYSSVSADAIYFDRPVVYYIPDFDQYCGSDRGLTDGFDNVTFGPKVYNASDMTDAVIQCMNSKTDVDDRRYAALKKTFFDGKQYSYEQQMRDILNAISQ